MKLTVMGVTADCNVIGVRPSSGAASTGCSDASDSIGARSRSDIAAPEDGRTPPRRSRAVADPVPEKPNDTRKDNWPSRICCVYSARMSALLLAGGRVIDPANQLDAVADLLIVGGKIAAIGNGAAAQAPANADRIEAAGLIVCPG